MYFLQFYYRNNVHFSVKGIHEVNMLYYGDINFHHLVKVVSTRFLYCKVIFPFVVNQFLGHIL